MNYLNKIMQRESSFSFDCKACGRCCRNKKIQPNPYELLRLSDFLGISTGEFLDKFTRLDSPYLLFSGDNDTCVFLNEQDCSVYPVRPLVCRLYPLRKYLSGDRKQHFKCIERHPNCKGIMGERDTIEDFLESQQTEPYMKASGQYLDLFDHLHQVLQRKLEGRNTGMPDRDGGTLELTLAEWFDVDWINSQYCNENELPIPGDTDSRAKLHIRALEKRFGQPKENA